MGYAWISCLAAAGSVRSQERRVPGFGSATEPTPSPGTRASFRTEPYNREALEGLARAADMFHRNEVAERCRKHLELLGP